MLLRSTLMPLIINSIKTTLGMMFWYTCFIMFFYPSLFSVLLIILAWFEFYALFSFLGTKPREKPKFAIFSKFMPKPETKEERVGNDEEWRIEVTPTEAREKKWKSGLILEEKWRMKQERSFRTFGKKKTSGIFKSSSIKQ